MNDAGHFSKALVSVRYQRLSSFYILSEFEAKCP